ncbi:MAG: hypothetical protein QOJ42_215 [Acidobacteriaceae bacterium]|jgi:hypothetical protein|nr:hypothetical protein [Acidobacteriaceae bacterium]
MTASLESRAPAQLRRPRKMGEPILTAVEGTFFARRDRYIRGAAFGSCWEGSDPGALRPLGHGNRFPLAGRNETSPPDRMVLPA